MAGPPVRLSIMADGTVIPRFNRRRRALALAAYFVRGRRTWTDEIPHRTRASGAAGPPGRCPGLACDCPFGGEIQGRCTVACLRPRQVTKQISPGQRPGGLSSPWDLMSALGSIIPLGIWTSITALRSINALGLFRLRPRVSQCKERIRGHQIRVAFHEPVGRVDPTTFRKAVRLESRRDQLGPPVVQGYSVASVEKVGSPKRAIVLAKV